MFQLLISKSDMRKLRTSSVKSLSTLFSYSIRVIYNIFNSSQKNCLMLKLYLTGINTSILPKRHYNNICYEKIVNELHVWIENHPHLIQSPNESDFLFVKIMVLFLSIYFKYQYESCTMIWYYQFPNICFGAIPVDGKVSIGNTSLRKYMKIYIKSTINRKKITCWLGTCISAMLLQKDINKKWLPKLVKIYKFYINYASSRLLKYIIFISLNTGMKYLQIIHIYVYYPVMLFHNIIVTIQIMDEIFQHQNIFWIAVLVVQGLMLCF